MAETTVTGETLWEWMDNAQQRVQDRLERVARTLESAGIPYAIIGGNAVQAWVRGADESLVRSTRDVDIVLQREQLETAIAALEAQGFIYQHAAKVTMFLDGPDAKARDAVHVVFAGEKVRPEYATPVPLLAESERVDGLQTLSLEALVRLKLTSYRLKDRVHIQDLIDAKLVDSSWLDRVPPSLAERLQEMLDDNERESLF